MSAISVKTAPTIEDVLMAADTVDTIRHEMAIQETEILSDDRRSALKARLRQYYESQGIIVADEIIERAVEGMDKNRYTHEPLGPGFSRFLAGLWVNRKRVVRNSLFSVIALVFVGGSVGLIHNELIVKPRERAAVELRVELETRLPQELTAAYSEAVSLAKKMEDEVALVQVDSLREATSKYITAEEVSEARNGIEKIKQQIHTLKVRASVISLYDEYEKITDDLTKEEMDDRAKRSLNPLIEELEASVRKADTSGFQAAKKKLNDQLNRIKTPLTLRVVDRSDVRSGVWRTPDNNRTKVHYLVVEALDVNGVPVAFPIKNYETGRTETVAYWGVRVPEEEYNKVGRDKQDNGVIDEFNVGSKPAGTLEFKWSIPQLKDQMITRW